MHGRGSRRNSGQSFGSDGRAVNVWRTSPERLRGGTRAAFIGCWQSMEALLPHNITGITFIGASLGEKRLELARELVPNVGVIALLTHPRSPDALEELRELQS